MTKLPVVSGAELVRALEKRGFMVIRQRGSHIVLQRRDAHQIVTTVIPNHKELAKGTLHTILKKVQLTPDELVKLLTLLLGVAPLLK
jgi:predicted RNA binding protein YcfA (HicA-like mRNA interferase family)